MRERAQYTACVDQSWIYIDIYIGDIASSIHRAKVHPLPDRTRLEWSRLACTAHRS